MSINRYDQIGTINAVKLLPKVDNYNGYIKLYTELDSHIETNDIVYITYDGDLNNITLNDLILDNYNTVLNSNNNIYDLYSTGYKILYVNKNNNSIVINKKITDIDPNKSLNDHYVSKVSCFNINIEKANIDSTLIKNGVINTTELQNNVNIIQCIMFNGDINNVNINHKYSDDYLSQKTIYNDDNSISYTLSKNNNGFGYSYFYNLNSSIKNCNLYSGNYINCNIYTTETKNIKGGNFINCYVDKYKISDGYFFNTILNNNCEWKYGKWDGDLNNSASTFNLSKWENGIFINGKFGENNNESYHWYNGDFLNGEWYGDIWFNGNFSGGYLYGKSGYTEQQMVGSYWLNGLLKGGTINPNFKFNWKNGQVLGGNIYNTIFNDGTIYSGNFYNSNIKNTDIKGGYFYNTNSITDSNIYNINTIGDRSNEKIEISDSNIYDGNLKYTYFYSNNIIENGEFEDCFFTDSITINNGLFKGNSEDILYQNFIPTEIYYETPVLINGVPNTPTTIEIDGYLSFWISGETTFVENDKINAFNSSDEYKLDFKVSEIFYDTSTNITLLITNIGLINSSIIIGDPDYDTDLNNYRDLDIKKFQGVTLLPNSLQNQKFSFSKASIRSIRIKETNDITIEDFKELILLDFKNGHNFTQNDKGKSVYLYGFISLEFWENNQPKQFSILSSTTYNPTNYNGTGYDEINSISENYIILDEEIKPWFIGDSGIVKKADLNDTITSASTTPHTINNGKFINTVFKNYTNIYNGQFNNTIMNDNINFYNGIFNGGEFKSYNLENNWYGGKFNDGVFGNNLNQSGMTQKQVVSIFNGQSYINRNITNEETDESSVIKIDNIYPLLYIKSSLINFDGSFIYDPKYILTNDEETALSGIMSDNDVWDLENKLNIDNTTYKVSPYEIVFKIKCTEEEEYINLKLSLNSLNTTDGDYIDIISDLPNDNINYPYKTWTELFGMDINYKEYKEDFDNLCMFLIFEFKDIKNIYDSVSNKVQFNYNFKNVWSIANTGYYTHPLPVLDDDDNISSNSDTNITFNIEYDGNNVDNKWICGTIPPPWLLKIISPTPNENYKYDIDWNQIIDNYDDSETITIGNDSFNIVDNNIKNILTNNFDIIRSDANNILNDNFTNLFQKTYYSGEDIGINFYNEDLWTIIDDTGNIEFTENGTLTYTGYSTFSVWREDLDIKNNVEYKIDIDLNLSIAGSNAKLMIYFSDELIFDNITSDTTQSTTISANDSKKLEIILDNGISGNDDVNLTFNSIKIAPTNNITINKYLEIGSNIDDWFNWYIHKNKNEKSSDYNIQEDEYNIIDISSDGEYLTLQLDTNITNITNNLNDYVYIKYCTIVDDNDNVYYLDGIHRIEIVSEYKIKIKYSTSDIVYLSSQPKIKNFSILPIKINGENVEVEIDSVPYNKYGYTISEMYELYNPEYSNYEFSAIPGEYNYSNRYNFQDAVLFNAYHMFKKGQNESYIDNLKNSSIQQINQVTKYNLFSNIFSNNLLGSDVNTINSLLSEEDKENFEHWNSNYQTNTTIFNLKAGIQFKSMNPGVNISGYTDNWYDGQFFGGTFQGKWSDGKWINGNWTGWNIGQSDAYNATQAPTIVDIRNIYKKNYIIDYNFLKRNKLYYEIAPWDDASKKQNEKISLPIRKKR